MLNFYGISLLVLGGIMGGLFVYFLRYYKIFYYKLFVISMFLWVITSGIAFLISSSLWVNILNRIVHVEGIWIVTFMYFFSLSFPYIESLLKLKRLRIFSAIIYSLNVILMTIIIFTNLILGRITNWLELGKGSYFFVHVIYFCILWALGYFNLIRRFQKTGDYQHHVILILLIGITLTSLIALPICFGMPMLNLQWNLFLIWLAPFSSIFWLGATLWILGKRGKY